MISPSAAVAARRTEAPLASSSTSAQGGDTRRPGAVTRWVVVGLLLWLFVGPRIPIPGTPALRVEDLVLAALGLICLRHVRFLGRPDSRLLAVTGVVLAGLLSVGVAAARGMLDPGIAALYAVRPLEYWVAFPAAMLIFKGVDQPWRRRFDLVLVAVTVLQMAFAVLQYYFRQPIGFSVFTYERAAGLTAGPYELGAISAALIVYWVSRRRFAMASMATIALAASISRISALATCLGLAILAIHGLVRLRRHVAAEGWHWPVPRGRAILSVLANVAAVGAAALVLGMTFGLIHVPASSSVTPSASAPSALASGATSTDQTTPTPLPSSPPPAEPEPELDAPAVPAESLVGRLATTSVFRSWVESGKQANAVPPLHTAGDYQTVAYPRLYDFLNVGGADSVGAEPSALIRFFRWHLLLNTIDDPLDVVFGLGPSFAGPSVDGSYVRFFADGGVVGVIAWVALIVVWLRRSPVWMTALTVTLLVGGVFIDILYAERPMVLFWTLLALALKSTSRHSAIARTIPEREAVLDRSSA